MTTITTNGLCLMADVCLRCGARIYPATTMERHLARHIKLDEECTKEAPWYGRRVSRNKGNRGWSTKRK